MENNLLIDYLQKNKFIKEQIPVKKNEVQEEFDEIKMKLNDFFLEFQKIGENKTTKNNTISPIPEKQKPKKKKKENKIRPKIDNNTHILKDQKKYKKNNKNKKRK